jgi:hypothetical protein
MTTTKVRTRTWLSPAEVIGPFPTSGGDQGVQHVPAGDPENVASHHRQLDLTVHQVLLPAMLTHQVDPIAGQVPQQPE